MSIISSHTLSSVSSILKGKGVRASLVGGKKSIRFKLPSNLKTILTNYENGFNRQEYFDIICILRDSSIKDLELLDLLKNLQECMSMLGRNHKLLIEVLLNLNWTNRTHEVITHFKKFIEDLMCLQSHHSELIIDKLVFQFKLTEEGDTQWPGGICPEKYLNKTSHVHDLLRKFLKIIPITNDILLQSINSQYPHSNEQILVIQQYQFSLLQILDYAPYLRKDILGSIIRRLIALDTNINPSEIIDDEDMSVDDEEIFNFDETAVENSSKKFINIEMKRVAEILDVCMEQVLAYVYNCCHVDKQLHIEHLKIIYNDLIYILERMILMTHECHHVQFIMFYICSFKPIVAETFVKWLWQRVLVNIAPTMRQTSVSYISSLLARAKYIKTDLIQNMLLEMSTWIHSYISSQDLESSKNTANHAIFYSVCQAMFYLLAFKHKDLTKNKQQLLFLQGLQLNSIVTCRLNPLKFCQPAVVQNFAAITRKYQLAYCYTIIERNSRNNLTILHDTKISTNNMLTSFFPFDPYILEISGQRITPLYIDSQSLANNTTNLNNLRNKSECDENDFMDESFISRSLEAQNNYDQFSYSTSPGFMYM